jgi:hypothetical protein
MRGSPAEGKCTFHRISFITDWILVRDDYDRVVFSPGSQSYSRVI